MSNTFQIEHLSFTTATVPASEYIKLAVLNNAQIATPHLLTFIPSQQLWFTKHDITDPASESDLDNQLQSLRLCQRQFKFDPFGYEFGNLNLTPIS